MEGWPKSEACCPEAGCIRTDTGSGQDTVRIFQEGNQDA